MRKLFPFLQLAALMLAVSVLAHGSFLLEWARDRYMTGIGDGLAQMLPFKKLLYDQYTSGEFFYSESLGLGSGTYSVLSYYFSTSVVFLLTVMFFYILESIGAIPHPDILFWADAAVFINTFRLAAVLAIAFHVFRYMKLRPVLAFLGAAVYGLSPMYFRHAVYWEFFADAYLWLPLLILGIEKIFREQKPGWFVFAVAISMIDNFYFAYVNFLLAALYLFLRFYTPLEENEAPRSRAVKMLLSSGLIGAGISAVSFIPAVYAFFSNYRPPFTQEIDWFDFSDNILITSRFVILPAVVMLLMFAFPLYRDRRFRFFAILTGIGVLLHYSPMAASMFNGFGAPRFRWEHFLSFTAGGMAAYGLNRLSLLKKPTVLTASLAAVFIYALFLVTDSSLEGRLLSGSAAAAGMLLVTLLLLIRAARDSTKIKQAVIGIVLLLVLFVNGYQQVMLTVSGELENVTEAYISSPYYDDPEIRQLLEQVREREGNAFYRIDWMKSVRNNTPLVQDFRGVSAYSSILNGELLHFYLHDLKIDMGRESISRYATLGRRANLHSLLKADYVILEQDNRNVPHGFEQVLSSEHFEVYENKYQLPFVRGTSEIFSEEQLKQKPVLQRERAMLSGMVMKNPASSSPLPPEPEERSFTVEAVEGSYQEGTLTVTEETGGINLILDEPVSPESDLYVSFHLTNAYPGNGFPLSVNSYRTTRKPNESLYRTFADELTIRIPAEENIQVRMPEGTYQLTNIAVFEETYQFLRTEAAEEADTSQAEWNGSRLRAEFVNDNGASYLTFPVPYEKGWSAEVNGEKTDVLEVNYAFIGIPAEQGHNTIELTYRPPYFHVSLGISLFSVLLAGIYFQRRKIK